MKIKAVTLSIVFLILISMFSSCNISETSDETSISITESKKTDESQITENNCWPDIEAEVPPNISIDSNSTIRPGVTETHNTNSEFDDEIEVEVYPDIEEAETDLLEVDYSKFIFVTEIANIESNKELSVHDYNDARQMIKAAEARVGEPLVSSSREDAVALLKQIIENGKDNKYSLMISVEFKGTFGAYYVGMGYIECYGMYPNSGEKQDLLFYTAKKMERINAEKFILSWERFTKYSHITSITFYTVPVVNVTE